MLRKRVDVELVVDAVATYRLTRLVTKDVITAPLRDSFVEAMYVAAGRAEAARPEIDSAQLTWSEYAEDDRNAPKLATLVVCRWCASIWLALGVVVIRRAAPRSWRRIAEILVFSAASALLARLEDG